MIQKTNQQLQYGRWTRQEHLRFTEALRLYGKNWRNIKAHVGTRSGPQIRSHAQKFFNRIQREFEVKPKRKMTLDNAQDYITKLKGTRRKYSADILNRNSNPFFKTDQKTRFNTSITLTRNEDSFLPLIQSINNEDTEVSQTIINTSLNSKNCKYNIIKTTEAKSQAEQQLYALSNLRNMIVEKDLKKQVKLKALHVIENRRTHLTIFKMYLDNCKKTHVEIPDIFGDLGLQGKQGQRKQSFTLHKSKKLLKPASQEMNSLRKLSNNFNNLTKINTTTTNQPSEIPIQQSQANNLIKLELNK